jgi:phosphohistidine phosphatase
MRTLMVLRHAQTEGTRPGSTDHARRLTPDGERQAVELGEHLRTAGVEVDVALCSSATRARQTLDALRLDARQVVLDALYNAGGDDIVAVLRNQDDAVRTVLVVGHAPGLPSVASELADPQASDPQALAAIEWRFPAGTLATLHVPGSWASLGLPADDLDRSVDGAVTGTADGAANDTSAGPPALVSVRLP